MVNMGSGMDGILGFLHSDGRKGTTAWSIGYPAETKFMM